MPLPAPPVPPGSLALAGKDVPAHISKFVDDFYRVTDEEQPDEYVKFFTPDAEFFVTALRRGRDEIHAGCSVSYTQRDNCVHRYRHVVVTEPDREVYVIGEIDFDRKADGEHIRNVPWVARMRLQSDQEGLKIADYYAWVVSFVCNKADNSASLL